MASTKRYLAEDDNRRSSSKKPKHCRVFLNPADCDLDFNIDCNGVVGYGLHEEGFAYCWSGARANMGITKGRYCFGCKIVSAQSVDMDDTAPQLQHVCRLGVSRGDDTVGNLGESKHSFGYGGTGKFSNCGRFLNFGDKFGVGDTIVCCIDLESKPLASIGFSKNGKWLGVATQFDVLCLGVGDSPTGNLKWNSALFPHVLLKNVVVQMQFSVEDGLLPEQGFKPWALAVEDRNVIMGPTFSDRRDCEVIMMVGLPASGKTTWAEKWVKDHPEKRYVLLGTNLILDQMKVSAFLAQCSGCGYCLLYVIKSINILQVPGLLRKNNYGERFDLLMDRATGIFNILLSRAANIPRNYIIDQTNVYKTARKRKLMPFADYHKIAVVVFPKPEDLKIRSAKRFTEMGKEVPSDAVNKMIANYVLPKSKDMPYSDEFFDQVMFVELNRGKSQQYLDEMKQSIVRISDHNSLSPGSSFGSFAGSAVRNKRSLTGSGLHQSDSYSPITPPNYGIPSQVIQVNANGTINSFPEVCPGSQIPHDARAPSCGLYSISESSRFPRDIVGYNQTYNAIPMSDNRNYNNSVMGPYRPNVVGNYMVHRDADSYNSGMNEPSPISRAMSSSTASARLMSSDYRTHREPYHGAYKNGMNESYPIESEREMSFNYSTRSETYPTEVYGHSYGGFQPGLHAHYPSTFDSLSQYEMWTPRPPYGRNASQRPRYF
ncbi:hypothetical protein Fmac_009897 [Flemingia macrophylla]|uniref:SPRY domain-containing protein n=1 Tax=Flemingia macrophylla TaxID=520843 RepID=A0ABD1N2E5_9FABA